jgi:RecA-family ATPase
MLKFYRGPDYVKLPRAPHKFIIQDLVPTGGLVNIYGKPKSHKSFAALGMAQAVAQGLPDWNGYPVHIHGPVAYLQVDTPREEWADRFDVAIALGQDTSNIWIADMLTVPYPLNIIDPEHF